MVTAVRVRNSLLVLRFSIVWDVTQIQWVDSYRAVDHKQCSGEPKKSATISQGIRRYISLMATYLPTYIVLGAESFLRSKPALS